MPKNQMEKWSNDKNVTSKENRKVKVSIVEKEKCRKKECRLIKMSMDTELPELLSEWMDGTQH